MVRPFAEIKRRLGFPFFQDIASLQPYIDNDAVFVCIDIEGTPNISEVGISILPPSSLRSLVKGDVDDAPPSDMHDFCQKYNLETYSFRVNGAHMVLQLRGKRRGLAQFGIDHIQWLDRCKLADAVLEVLHDVRKRYPAPHPFVLTGYHMGMEIGRLDDDLVNLVKNKHHDVGVEFAACVDIRDVILAMARDMGLPYIRTPSVAALMEAARLVLREVNTVEEIESGNFVDLANKKLLMKPHPRHAAANDVVCELAVLSHMLFASSLFSKQGKQGNPGPRPDPLTDQTDNLRKSVDVPLCRKLAKTAESGKPFIPIYPGRTDEEMVMSANARRDRLLERKERESFDNDENDFGLASSLDILELSG